MNGVELIAAERERQQRVEGWTPEHDDEHRQSEMSSAALAYGSAANRLIRYGMNLSAEERRGALKWIPNDWPLGWESGWWKPSDDPIRNLVKAGALIAAEIDRLQRISK